MGEAAGSKGGEQLVKEEEERWQFRCAGSRRSRLLPERAPMEPVPVSSQDGVWVRGLYLEGAGWDRKNSCLVEAEPMQLVCLMPTIHFRPTESRKKSAKGGLAPSDGPSPSLVWTHTCSRPALPWATGL